jgi:hypothetical protein
MSLVKPFFLLTILASLIAGCSHPDQRLVEFSSRANEQQARQNQQMATLQEEVAAGSRRLVELDGQARQEFLAMSHDLQQQSSQVASERHELEQERKMLAAERRMAPIVAAAITSASLIVACLLPLVLSAALLRPSSTAGEGEALVDLLVNELALSSPQEPAHSRIPEGPPAPRID